MSTIGHETWAVDLADVGPVYPLQGWEGIMVAVGVVFWLAWHWVQFTRESAHLKQAQKRARDHETIQSHIENY